MVMRTWLCMIWVHPPHTHMELENTDDGPSRYRVNADCVGNYLFCPRLSLGGANPRGLACLRVRYIVWVKLEVDTWVLH